MQGKARAGERGGTRTDEMHYGSSLSAEDATDGTEIPWLIAYCTAALSVPPIDWIWLGAFCAMYDTAFRLFGSSPDCNSEAGFDAPRSPSPDCN